MTDLKEVAEQACIRLQELLGDNLALLAVTGSVARGDITPGWSDIDILCVVNQLDNQTYDAIRTAISSTDIAIGVTMYNCAEFQVGTSLDTKTKLSTYYIQEGFIQPVFARPELRLPEQNPREILAAEVENFGKILHSARRQLLLGPHAYNERTLLKLLYVLCKIIVHMRSHSLQPMGYTPSSELAAYTADITPPHPREVLKDPAGSVRRYTTYVRLIDTFVQCLNEEAPRVRPTS
jgi:predicted nucleotidyltransferase